MTCISTFSLGGSLVGLQNGNTNTIANFSHVSLYWKTSLDLETPFSDISNPLNFMADFTPLAKEKIRVLIEILKIVQITLGMTDIYFLKCVIPFVFNLENISAF
jgi:hypothetical protein